MTLHETKIRDHGFLRYSLPVNDIDVDLRVIE